MSTTRDSSDWENTEFLGGLEDIKKLRDSDGDAIKVWGSSQLIQLLLKNDFVDELWLNTYPITLGNGKKLFQDGAIPATFTLVESNVTPSGVIMAHYERAGDVMTGTVGEQ